MFGDVEQNYDVRSGKKKMYANADSMLLFKCCIIITKLTLVRINNVELILFADNRWDA